MKLDIKKCFSDAFEVFKKNWLIMALATLLIGILSVVSLFILVGALSGGFAVFMLKAMRNPEKKADLKDIFSSFSKFLPLTGLFILQTIPIFAGTMLFVIPGILLATMWLYTFYFMMDKNTGVMDSLKSSWALVKEKGLGINLGLCVIYLLLVGGGNSIPYVGWLISLAAVPIGALAITSAYLQQTETPVA